jgi:hypothetical protein
MDCGDGVGCASDTDCSSGTCNNGSDTCQGS